MTRAARLAALGGVVVLAAAPISMRGSVGSAGVAPTSVAVYLTKGEAVAPVRRVVPRTPAVARAALIELLRGPTAQERQLGYRTSIPPGTTLRRVTVSRGIATVDLSRRFAAGGGSASMLLRVAQVVHTATRFPSVQRVAFRLDGRPVRSIGGEGVVVSPPVGRAAFEAQSPPILVEQPLPDDAVGTSILVSGTADVFEAQLVVEARALDGMVLVRKHVAASAGTGTRGTFRVRLHVAAAFKRLVVAAYARSPKDGSVVDLVVVPVVR